MQRIYRETACSGSTGLFVLDFRFLMILDVSALYDSSSGIVDEVVSDKLKSVKMSNVSALEIRFVTHMR